MPIIRIPVCIIVMRGQIEQRYDERLRVVIDSDHSYSTPELFLDIVDSLPLSDPSLRDDDYIRAYRYDTERELPTDPQFIVLPVAVARELCRLRDAELAVKAKA